MQNFLVILSLIGCNRRNRAMQHLTDSMEYSVSMDQDLTQHVLKFLGHTNALHFRTCSKHVHEIDKHLEFSTLYASFGKIRQEFQKYDTSITRFFRGPPHAVIHSEYPEIIINANKLHTFHPYLQDRRHRDTSFRFPIENYHTVGLLKFQLKARKPSIEFEFSWGSPHGKAPPPTYRFHVRLPYDETHLYRNPDDHVTIEEDGEIGAAEMVCQYGDTGFICIPLLNPAEVRVDFVNKKVQLSPEELAEFEPRLLAPYPLEWSTTNAGEHYMLELDIQQVTEVRCTPKQGTWRVSTL